MYKFRSIYHNFGRPRDLLDAQRRCLSMFEDYIYQNKDDLNFVDLSDLQMRFQSYVPTEYPDQTDMRNFFRCEYTNEDGDIYWCGEKYDDFEKFYQEISQQKCVMELTVENLSLDK